MSRPPRVSIGMPLYDAERYLREAFDSLLGQSFRDFELVISDNGSTDQTESICREYASRDDRIKYHRESENRGAIWNFNRVFERSVGEYFKWAAYDDLCDATLLEKCVGCLDADRDVVWCHALTNHIDADGNILVGEDDPTLPGNESAHSLLFTDYGLPRQTRASATPYERFEGVLMGTTWCADSYGLIRADALRKTRLLQDCYGAEKVLMGELSLHGRYRELPEVLFFERIHEQASGALSTAAAQRKFMGGTRSCAFSSTRWQLLKGHIGAVLHAPLGPIERLRCLAVIARYVLQVRKWNKILSQTLRGVGIGAETRTSHETGAGRVTSTPVERAGSTVTT